MHEHALPAVKPSRTPFKPEGKVLHVHAFSDLNQFNDRRFLLITFCD